MTVTGPGGPTTVRQTVRSDFLSRESRVPHVGLGGRERVDPTVTWPGGTRRTYEDVTANQLRIRITKAGVETIVTCEKKE